MDDSDVICETFFSISYCVASTTANGVNCKLKSAADEGESGEIRIERKREREKNLNPVPPHLCSTLNSISTRRASELTSSNNETYIWQPYIWEICGAQGEIRTRPLLIFARSPLTSKSRSQKHNGKVN